MRGLLCLKLKTKKLLLLIIIGLIFIVRDSLNNSDNSKNTVNDINEINISTAEESKNFYLQDGKLFVRDNSKYTNNKELMIIPGAVHTDLYDRKDIIPFDKMEEFFRKYLK